MNAQTPATILIAAKTFDADEEIRVFRRRHKQAGAIASFLGQVRGTHGDDVVTSLRLEHYPGFTEQAIDGFAQRALTRWPLNGLRIIHRVGLLCVGEPIVFVAAAADHRRPAFEAVDYLMDYLKTQAPFWKEEISEAGARWVEPREADYSDHARWCDTADKSERK